MNTQQLLKALKSPTHLQELTVGELQELVDTFPFFSAGHLLLVKKMQLTQHLHFTKAIKRTAIAVNDRKKLYTYLYQTQVQQSIVESLTVTPELEHPATESSSTITVEPTEEHLKTPVPLSAEEQTETTPPADAPEEEKAHFNAPVDLKTLSSKPKEEIDALEQQIIGHTIEHMLSQEISHKYPAKEVKETTIEEPIKDSQKFSEWLEILDHKRLAKQRAEKEDALSEANIIDSFLNKDINIISPTPNELDFTPNNLARLSVVDDNEFVTETLANIYAKQGNYEKAIATFNKLIAKYPEKKTYFAGRIRKIEQEINNK